MRYIGNKESLLERLYQEILNRNIVGNSFFDFFSGTTSVAKYFKNKGYQVYSCDLMYFSYVLQRAYIVNNSEQSFNKLLNNLDYTPALLFPTSLETIVHYLNQIEPVVGFISQNYTPQGTSDLEIPRMYFSNENGMIIDAIRQKIEDWKVSNLINDDEYFILLACLIETVPFYANIAGVYAAFQKKWDARAIKKLQLRTIEYSVNNKENFSYIGNSAELLGEVEADIFYLDPPYNHRQYAPNYHLLETIAKYDNPIIKGVGGLRDYSNQKSKFCNASTAVSELENIAKNGKYKYLILSYNTEGAMRQDDIMKTLSKYGKVELIEIDYLRFKSNNNGESKTKKFIKEQLYILKNDNT